MERNAVFNAKGEIRIKFLDVCDQQKKEGYDLRNQKIDDIRSVAKQAFTMWEEGAVSKNELNKILSNLLPVAEELERTSSYRTKAMRLFMPVNQEISTALKAAIASVNKVPSLVTKLVNDANFASRKASRSL